MVTSSISYLFDRGINSSHPWATGLRADEGRAQHFEQAPCTNLAMDWRVDAAAESRLLAEFAATFSSMPSIFDTIPRYFAAAYCKPFGGVKFLSEVVPVRPHRELLHVGSLGGMLNRIVGNADARSHLQEHFALTYGDSRFIPATGKLAPEDLAEVASAMQSGSEDDFRQTIELLHELLGPRQPFWWATYWSEVQHFKDDAEALVDALGMGEYLDGDVLLTYRYKAGDVSLIYCPTVIEANNYAFHYPSPQTLNGGLSMPLNNKLGACIEMIHHPLDASVAATTVIFRLLPLNAGKQMANQYDNLAACRASHRAALQRDYASKSPIVRSWLNRHASRF